MLIENIQFKKKIICCCKLVNHTVGNRFVKTTLTTKRTLKSSELAMRPPRSKKKKEPMMENI